MKDKLLELFNTRDKDFISRFCQEGTYLDESGKEIKGVCRTMTAEEVLTFMHTYDAYAVEAALQNN